MGKCLEKMHIADYYPLHDPFILKNIEVSPYLNIIKQLGKASGEVERNA